MDPPLQTETQTPHHDAEGPLGLSPNLSNQLHPQEFIPHSFPHSLSLHTHPNILKSWINSVSRCTQYPDTLPVPCLTHPLSSMLEGWRVGGLEGWRLGVLQFLPLLFSALTHLALPFACQILSCISDLFSCHWALSLSQFRFSALEFLLLPTALHKPITPDQLVCSFLKHSVNSAVAFL